MNAKELWIFKYNEPIFKIELSDINGNGQKEIIAITKGGKILILSLEGKLLHEQEISKNSAIWCVKSHDVDHDGNMELILGGLDGLLKVFKWSQGDQSFNLKLFWSHQFGTSISGIITNDVNNNGEDEIIAYSLDKTIRVLNSLDGSLSGDKFLKKVLEMP